MTNTQYDPSILQEFADRLYNKAGSIILWTAVRYGLYGFLFSGVLSIVLTETVKRSDFPFGILVVILTVVAVLHGISVGREKAFALKLQAQTILCQRQIELNSRVYRGASASA
jgi:hypothetical protein